MSGYLAAKRAGIGVPGRWRTGFVLTPRGEFSIVIAGLAVGAGVEPQLAPLATAYVLITVVAGSVLARVPDTSWFRKLARYPRAVPAAQVSQPLRQRVAAAGARSQAHPIKVIRNFRHLGSLS